MGIEWRKYTLDDLCVFKYGQMPKKTDLCDDGYPVFSGYHIVGKATTYHYEEPEIIVVARGVGGTGDVKMSPPKCFLTNLSIVAKVASPEVDKEFLYYRLAGPKLWELRTGSAQAQITIDRLKRYELRLPPLPTQRKIAAILSAYDDLIENNLHRIKILEKMAQNLYCEWFVKFRFPGHQNVRFVDSALGKIPEGWEVRRLDQIVLFQNHGTKAGEHLKDCIYLPIDCIPRRSLAISQVKPWEEAQSSLHLFDAGDILFGAMRPYFHKVIVAPFKGVTRRTCFVFKSVSSQYHAFAALTLFQDETVSFANAHSKGATIPYAVWPQSMDTMPVVVPSIGLAEKYEEIVSPIISRIGVIYFQNTTLRHTRDFLLPRLISGEVDVSELDITIPEEAIQ